MTFKPEKRRADCFGCATGSVSLADRAAGKVFCSTCYENFRRVILGEKLLDANQRVRR
jgi:hypothetical protein